MLSFLCLSVLVAGACAIVCTPDICATVRCAAVTNDNCNGMIKENGGYCGCCDACITELGGFNVFLHWKDCIDLCFNTDWLHAL